MVKYILFDTETTGNQKEDSKNDNYDIEPSSFDICYSVGSAKGLNLVNIERQKLQWYQFQNSQENIAMIKYIDSTQEEFNVSFDFNDDFIRNPQKLIIITPNKDKAKVNIYVLNLINVEKFLDFNKKGYIKFKNKKAFFYPYSKAGQLSIEYSFEIITLNIIDSKTLSRYKSIMERNYLQQLNYLLFIIGCYGLKNLEDAWSIYSKLREDIQKRYKDLYSNIANVRKRNKCFNEFKAQNSGDIKKFEKKYYNYFQEKILKFDDFSEFWNKEKSKTCKYCDISEEQINILHKENKVETKRFYSRGQTMEIDKKNAFGEYTKCNIILSCYWCNNAKTDEFTLEEFKSIAKGINEVWNNRLGGSNIKFPDSMYNKENNCNEK